MKVDVLLFTSANVYLVTLPGAVGGSFKYPSTTGRDGTGTVDANAGEFKSRLDANIRTSRTSP